MTMLRLLGRLVFAAVAGAALAQLLEAHTAPAAIGIGARAVLRDTSKAARPAGLVPFLKALWRGVADDRLLSVAAAVAFYGLLSLVPALAALISLYGLLADPASVVAHITRLATVLPADIAAMIGEQALRISGKPPATLGFAFTLSLVLSLWSSNAAMKAMFDALNIAFEQDEKRSLVLLTLQTLLFTLGAILFILAAIGATVLLPVVLDGLWLGPMAEQLLNAGRWPVMLLLVSLALALLYHFGPSRSRPVFRWLTPGIAFASLAWLAMSGLFTWYAASFARFNETYGSLGAAAAIMTWLWLSALITLIGAEIDSLTPRR